MIESEDQQDQSLQSMSDEETQFRREEIHFPSPASQFTELYYIYQRNSKKISQLNQELIQRQSQIIDLQQLTNEQQVGSIIDFSQEQTEQEVEARLNVYNSQRQKRTREIGRLQEVYRKLKVLATQENLLNNGDMNELLHQWLAQHKKIISIKAEGSDLVVLSQESRIVHYFTRKNKNVSLATSFKKPRSKGDLWKSIDKRNSKDSMSSEDNPKHKKQYSCVYTIRVINIENFIKRLEEAGVQNSPELQAKKNEEQLYNMLIRLIRVGLKKKTLLSQDNIELNRKVTEEIQKNKREIYEIIIKLARMNEDKEKRLPSSHQEQDCLQLRQANKRQAEIYSKLFKLIQTNQQTKKSILHNQSDIKTLEQISNQQEEISSNLNLLIKINEDKKQYLPIDINLEQSKESLEQKQKQAEIDVNLVQLVQIDYKNKTSVLICTYSKVLQLFFLYVKSNKILVVQGKRDTLSEIGNVIQIVDLDSIDDLILLEVRGNQLYTGTKEGVIRIYQILINKLQLTHVYRCFHREVKWIDTYHLSSEIIPNSFYFISDHNQVFEFNTNSYLVTHIGDLPERATSILENYLITDSSIYKIVFKNPLQLTRNDKLTDWYTSYRLNNPLKQIIHIHPSPNQPKVLTADKKGNISVISV